MNTHKKEWFKNEIVKLDGQCYEECTFENCTLVFFGGETPILDNNTFMECTWDMGDAAGRTIGFLGVLHIAGLGDIVDGWFRQVRSLPELPEPPDVLLH